MEKDAPGQHGIPTVHVPVPTGECIVVPHADLANFTRYAWWSRAVPDLFMNAGWRRLAVQLQPQLREFTQDSLGDYVALFPFSLQNSGMFLALQRAALNLDPRPFEAIAAALRKRKPKALGAKAQEAIDSIHTAAKKIGGSPSRLAAVSTAAGGEGPEDAEYERLNAHYKKFARASSNQYPRVHRVATRDENHVGRTHRLFAGSTMAPSVAPALYLGREDHGEVGKGAIPPGEPVLALEYGGWAIKVTRAGLGKEAGGSEAEPPTDLDFRFIEQPRVPLVQDPSQPKPRRRPRRPR